MLRKLEERGYVRREANANDRRAAIISMTDSGRSVVDELFPRATAYRSRSARRARRRARLGLERPSRPSRHTKVRFRIPLTLVAWPNPLAGSGRMARMHSTACGAATTTREEFNALAAVHRVVPVTRKVLADSETPLSAYRKLGRQPPGTFLLESAENGL